MALEPVTLLVLIQLSGHIWLCLATDYYSPSICANVEAVFTGKGRKWGVLRMPKLIQV